VSEYGVATDGAVTLIVLQFVYFDKPELAIFNKIDFPLHCPSPHSKRVCTVQLLHDGEIAEIIRRRPT